MFGQRVLFLPLRLQGLPGVELGLLLSGSLLGDLHALLVLGAVLCFAAVGLDDFVQIRKRGWVVMGIEGRLLSLSSLLLSVGLEGGLEQVAGNEIGSDV